MKKEAPSTIVKARLQEESAWCRLGKQLIIFLQVLFLLFCKFWSYMGAGILPNEENGRKFYVSSSGTNYARLKNSSKRFQRHLNRVEQTQYENVL
jgi:hypothetical protein